MKSPKVAVEKGIAAGNIKIPWDREARRCSLNRDTKSEKEPVQRTRAEHVQQQVQRPCGKASCVCQVWSGRGGGGDCRLGDKWCMRWAGMVDITQG